PTDHRSDICRFGTICYEMIAGRRAFQGESSLDTLNAIVKEDPPDLSEINPGIPAAVERAISHCLAKNPDDRFQSARDLVFALEPLVTINSRTAIPAANRIAIGKRPIVLAAFVIAAVLAVTFTAGRMSNDVSPPRFQRLT